MFPLGTALWSLLLLGLLGLLCSAPTVSGAIRSSNSSTFSSISVFINASFDFVGHSPASGWRQMSRPVFCGSSVHAGLLTDTGSPGVRLRCTAIRGRKEDRKSVV